MKRLTSIAAATILMLGAATANAAMMMTIDYGSNGSVDATGTAYSATTMGYMGTSSGWNINMASGTANADQNPLMHLTGSASASAGWTGGDRSVTMTFSEDAFTLSSAPNQTLFAAGAGGSTALDMEYTLTLTDASNVTHVLQSVSEAASATAYADNAITALNLSGVYKMEMVVTFSTTASGVSTPSLSGSIDSSVSVPVPATLALFGLGLLGLGWSRKKLN